MNRIRKELIDLLWQDSLSVEGVDPSLWRKDFAGAWIRRDQFGKHSDYGWTIDHIMPLSCGGSDIRANLQVIHWKNQVSKGDRYPVFITSVSSNGPSNIRKVRIWRKK